MGELVRRATAVGLGLTALLLLLAPGAPSDARNVQVVIATNDVPTGTELTQDHLDTISVLADQAPDGAITDVSTVIGQRTASPVRAGEILTDARMSGPPAFAVPAGYLPLVVPITDPQLLLTLREGDCVDLYAGYSGVPLSEIATSAILVSISMTAASEASSAAASTPPAHLVVGVTNTDVAAVLEALAADVILATLCHAWPTSVGQESA